MSNLKDLNIIDDIKESVLVRKNDFLGICLGMQMAVIEASRNLAKIKKTNKINNYLMLYNILRKCLKNILIFLLICTGSGSTINPDFLSDT